jgi:hypothetical protein
VYEFARSSSVLCLVCDKLFVRTGSGQAFVHDPRVSHVQSTETKAKIRLRYAAGSSHGAHLCFPLRLLCDNSSSTTTIASISSFKPRGSIKANETWALGSALFA